MSLEEVNSANAPLAVGPYSQAVKANGFLFCSGQIGVNPKTKELVGKTIEEETKQVMENLGAVLKSANVDFSNVVRSDIFITDMNNYTKVNEVYATYFTHKPLPARQTVEVVKLPRNAHVEISLIASIA